MTGNVGVEQWLAAQWAQAAVEFRAEIEGASLAVRGWNLAAAGRRPGIVLIHGFRAHARWWDHLAPALAEDRAVVALDLSGMGDSDRRAVYTRAGHGREALGVADALGWRRPTLIAHSYGAVAAITAANAEPDRVGRLIVIDSALPAPDEGDRMIPGTPSRTYPDMESAIARFRLMPPGGWPEPAVLAYIARHSAARGDDGAWRWKFDEQAHERLNRERNYRAAMLDTDVRADLIHGALSEVFTPPRQAQVPLILPRCGPPVVIPACHHHVLIEQPIALVAALRALLTTDDG